MLHGYVDEINLSFSLRLFRNQSVTCTVPSSSPNPFINMPVVGISQVLLRPESEDEWTSVNWELVKCDDMWLTERIWVVDV